VPDIIVGAGPGGGPHVKVIDGATGQLVREFMAYDEAFRGGVYVASGDIGGDGFADIITGAGGANGTPHVKVFSGADGQLLPHPVGSFMAFDERFRGGVRVAAGDVNGDGSLDIITAAGPNRGVRLGPLVQAFSGEDASLISSFLAYGPGSRSGVYVSTGDVTGDGTAEIISAPGPRGNGEVRVFRSGDPQPLRAFAPRDRFPGSIRVASYDFNGDDLDDILTASTLQGLPRLQVFSSASGDELLTLEAFDQPLRFGFFIAGAA
jgi:hypothetical protein